MDGLGISVSAGKSAVAEYEVEIEARLWLEAVWLVVREAWSG